MSQSNQATQDTIEIRPGEYESIDEKTINAHGEHAGFFHSLGRAISGETVNNEFLKSGDAVVR